MKFDFKSSKKWLFLFYVLIAGYTLLTVSAVLFTGGVSCSSVSLCIDSTRSILILAAIVVGFVLIAHFINWMWTWDDDIAVLKDDGQTNAGFYPNGVTRPVGWIVFFWLMISIVGLLFTHADPWNLSVSVTDGGRGEPQIHEMMLAIFGAGAGSSVATIMAYLRHASAVGDFARSFTPWYLMRPLLGSLLGLIFYFLLRGGIVSVLDTPPNNEQLDSLALTGISALVGLFSNEAYLKLQEVFSTMFQTGKRNPPTDAGSGQAGGKPRAGDQEA